MKPLLLIALGLIVGSHYVLLATNFYITVAMFWWGIYGVPAWAIATAVIHFELLAFYGHQCPLTLAENAIRRRLGWPEISGFIEHHVRGRTN